MAHTESNLEPMVRPVFDRGRIRPSYGVEASSEAADDEDEVRRPDVRRGAGLRRSASRIAGMLAIAAAIGGVAHVAADAKGRQAMADWLTLGHGSRAHDASEMVRGWAEKIGGR